MPIRIPVQAIIVQRDGKNKRPELNKPFDFTSEEIEHIKKFNPRAFRLPVNESAPIGQNAEEKLAMAKTLATARDPLLGDDGEFVENGGGFPAQGPTLSERQAEADQAEEDEQKVDQQAAAARKQSQQSEPARKVEANRTPNGAKVKPAGKADDDAL